MIYHDCNNFFDTKMITKVSLVIFIVKKKKLRIPKIVRELRKCPISPCQTTVKLSVPQPLQFRWLFDCWKIEIRIEFQQFWMKKWVIKCIF